MFASCPHNHRALPESQGGNTLPPEDTELEAMTTAWSLWVPPASRPASKERMYYTGGSNWP